MNTPVLLIIDVQQGLDDPQQGQRCNPQAEENIERLLTAWRNFAFPVIHVQHNSIEAQSKLRPELPGNAIKKEAEPIAGEPVIGKTTNSAFIHTDLESRLHQNQWQQLVIAGLTTDHCISASTRNASDLGFDVTLISDATAAFERIGHDGRHYSAEQIHNISLATLNGEFCRVISTDDCLNQLLQE